MIQKRIDEFKEMGLGAKLLLLWFMDLYFLTGACFILHRVGIDEGFAREFILAAVVSIPLASFFINIRKFDIKQYRTGFCLIAIVIFAVSLTLFIHPEYGRIFTKSGYGIERIIRPDCAIFAFLFVELVEKKEDLVKTIKMYAVLNFVYIVIIALIPRLLTGYFEDVNYLGELVKRPYSLSFGYSMLLPTIIFLYAYIKEKGKFYLLGSIIGIVSIFQFGNRGAWGLIWFFLGLMAISCMISSEKFRKKAVAKKILILLLIFAGMLFVAVYVPRIVGTVMNEIAAESGGKITISRTAEMATTGDITYDSGRNEIWDAVKDAIAEKPILGYGVYGDRQFVEPIHYVGYSHNIFLELVCNYGFIGMLLSIALVFYSIRMLFFCKDRDYRELFIIMFAVSSQLLLSMSYWYVIEFWIAAAIVHKYINSGGSFYKFKELLSIFFKTEKNM